MALELLNEGEPTWHAGRRARQWRAHGRWPPAERPAVPSRLTHLRRPGLPCLLACRMTAFLHHWQPGRLRRGLGLSGPRRVPVRRRHGRRGGEWKQHAEGQVGERWPGGPAKPSARRGLRHGRLLPARLPDRRTAVRPADNHIVARHHPRRQWSRLPSPPLGCTPRCRALSSRVAPLGSTRPPVRPAGDRDRPDRDRVHRPRRENGSGYAQRALVLLASAWVTLLAFRVLRLRSRKA
jgi:hypothetical protein